MSAAKIERIRTSGFGGGDFDLEFDKAVVLVHGPNGAGKSTIPAAIALALTGKVPSAGGTSPGAVIDAVGREGVDEVWAEVQFRDADGDQVEVGHRLFRKEGGGAGCQPSILGKATKPSSFERELMEMGVTPPAFLSIDWLVYDSRPNRGRAILDRFADPKKHGKVKLSLDEHKAKIKNLKEQLRGRRTAISTMVEEIKRIESGENKGALIEEVEREVAELRNRVIERSVMVKQKDADAPEPPAPTEAKPGIGPEADLGFPDLPHPGKAADPDGERLDLRTLVAVSKAMKARGCACASSAWVMKEKLKAKGAV